MVKISATIITLNEEKNIRRCLESLQGVVDEIVVVDSLSTDQTESICKEFNVKFVSQPFLGYVKQKNFATQQASNDYVFNIDADECLSEELKQEIIKIKSLDNPKQAYFCNRLNNYYGTWIKHCGLYPDKKLRLYDRTKGEFQGKYVHEKVVMQENAIIGYLKGDLIHYAYSSKEALLKQLDTFSTLRAKEYAENGKRVSFAKIILKTCWKFFRDYFILLGFLDGKKGFELCKIYSHYEYMKYSKTRTLLKENN
ncbi:MAG: glycosyltransferase family 2 protein [Bacteroidales bacterium]|nr:glycosyltransferase family 2 protein [Bacteroidales bacterium]